MAQTIRLASERDAAQVLAIYAPIVRDTAISFEVEPPSEGEIQKRIATTLEGTPWLVCDSESSVVGFAYAATHRPREAYQWSVDCSIYIRADYRARGLGRALYTSLFACLRLQGLYNVYAGITLPNPASVALHEAMGMKPVGVYRAVGYKRGLWHDVGWWQLALQDYATPPGLPRPMAEMIDTPGWAAALDEGQRLLSH